MTAVGSAPALVLTGVRQQKKRTLPSGVVRRALWRIWGVELGLESWVEVRSGQQEGFPGRREKVSVFRKPGPGRHIWVEQRACQGSMGNSHST